jgi:hypothetical protein
MLVPRLKLSVENEKQNKMSSALTITAGDGSILRIQILTKVYHSTCIVSPGENFKNFLK